MTDLRTKLVDRIIVAAGVVAGTALLIVILLAIMAVGGVWGPGWLGDLVDWITG